MRQGDIDTQICRGCHLTMHTHLGSERVTVRDPFNQQTLAGDVEWARDDVLIWDCPKCGTPAACRTT